MCISVLEPPSVTAAAATTTAATRCRRADRHDSQDQQSGAADGRLFSLQTANVVEGDVLSVAMQALLVHAVENELQPLALRRIYFHLVTGVERIA